MLRGHSRVKFAATFILTLYILLAFSLCILLHVQNSDSLGTKIISVEMVRDYILMAGIFLVFSGYLFAFLAVYCLVTHALSRWARVSVSILLFALAYWFFVSIIGNQFSTVEVSLLLLGTVSVVIADCVAEVISGQRTNDGSRG